MKDSGGKEKQGLHLQALVTDPLVGISGESVALVYIKTLAAIVHQASGNNGITTK